jgi:DNA mismatch repair protein MutL
MSVTIRILPEQLTNKIAAGEVVERPASVVKELVENALDAGGRDITVEIESGGKRLIRVTDDGHGMSREDALLSLERHATSKIASDSDLFTLTSLGFRGEALPSIASVSRCTLASRVQESLEGTEIYAEGGRIKEVKACGMARGTVITVRNLFFNTPARLKFLRSNETEGGHVGEFLNRLALSRPEVRFTFITDGKVSFTLGTGGLKERVTSLLGGTLAGGLYPVEYQEGECAVTGLVGRPETNRSTAGLVYTYINGRFIRDRVVQHAVLQAYRTLLERGRYPVVVLSIQLSPSEVDVNVHPTKHEVRFRNQGEIHDIIQRGVESVLRGTPWIQQNRCEVLGTGRVDQELRGEVQGSGSKVPSSESASETETLESGANGRDGGVVAREMTVSEVRKEAVRDALAAYRSPERPTSPPLPLPSFNFPASPRPISGPITDTAPLVATPASVPMDESSPLREEVRGGYFSSLAIIGQFKSSYLLCQDGDNLILIDQHAAHERVAFEKLRTQWHAGKVASQGLLFPETLEFSFGEAATLREQQEELEKFGFALEPFGGATWLLKEVPCLLSEGDPVGTLRDILEELRGVGRSRAISDVAEEALTTIACHSVVRGKRSLAPPEIAALLAQMDEVGFAANCPHGRPVYKALSQREIEKMFKR